MWKRLYENISIFWVMIMCLYRVIHHLETLVGLTKIWRVCGWWATPLDTCCPSSMMEYPRSKSTQPRSRGDGSPCMAVFKSGRL